MLLPRWLCWVFIYPSRRNRCLSAVGEVRGSMGGFKKPLWKINVPYMLLMAVWPQKKGSDKEHLFIMKNCSLPLFCFGLSNTPRCFCSFQCCVPLFCSGFVKMVPQSSAAKDWIARFLDFFFLLNASSRNHDNAKKNQTHLRKWFMCSSFKKHNFEMDTCHCFCLVDANILNILQMMLIFHNFNETNCDRLKTNKAKFPVY